MRRIAISEKDTAALKPLLRDVAAPLHAHSGLKHADPSLKRTLPPPATTAAETPCGNAQDWAIELEFDHANAPH